MSTLRISGMGLEMTLPNPRACPVCGGRPASSTFPYATRVNEVCFNYLKCGKCKSVFVDPVPDAEVFAQMYAKSAYHDKYYCGEAVAECSASVRLLSQHVKLGSRVLDYGCGLGGFLKACSVHGLVASGVEFDREAALFAAKHANCEVVSVEAFSKLVESPCFDAIHMGDVLEHLPDPLATVKHLLGFLKPGGVLFIEGPLEVNPSLVFWTARTFGAVKRVLKPTFMPSHSPTHLFRTDANAQRAFFTRADQRLKMRHWEVYETGWPYESGGIIKGGIAALAVFMGGRQLAGSTFGNRFKAILVKV